MSFWNDQKEFYRSPAWKKLSQECFKRDNYTCTYVDKGIKCTTKTGLEAHHIVARSKGGKDELFNLTTRCKYHHQMAHPHLRQKNIKSNFQKDTGPALSPVTFLPQAPIFKYKPTRPPGKSKWR